MLTQRKKGHKDRYLLSNDFILLKSLNYLQTTFRLKNFEKMFEKPVLLISLCVRSSFIDLTMFPWSQIIARFSLTSIVFFIRRKDKLLGPFIFPTQTLAITFLLIDTSANRLHEADSSRQRRSSLKKMTYRIYKCTIFYFHYLYMIVETITHLHLISK